MALSGANGPCAIAGRDAIEQWSAVRLMVAVPQRISTCQKSALHACRRACTCAHCLCQCISHFTPVCLLWSSVPAPAPCTSSHSGHVLCMQRGLRILCQPRCWVSAFTHSLLLFLFAVSVPAPSLAPAAKQDDCELGPGGARKACKNCSCGRAEAEAAGVKVTLTQEMLDNPQSACGNVSGWLRC
jgi:hypothetical protein